MTLRLMIAMVALTGVDAILCAQQQSESTQAINFTDHVLPIFRQHCLKCHNADEAEAGLAIDSYSALMEGSGSGDVVAAGDASASRLWLVMTHVEEPKMPPNQEPLPAETLDIVKQWITGGLLENNGSKARKPKGPSLTFAAKDDGAPSESIMPQSLWRVPVMTTSRTAAATALAASPSAPLVAVAGQRQVSLYHSDSADLLGILPYPQGIPQVLQFSRDGAYLLVAGGNHASSGSASLYDVRDGQKLLTVGDELDIVFGADLNDLSSRIALGGPQKVVRIFDTSSGQVEFELKKHTDWIYAVVYSPDGVLIASGDRSGGLHVWEADTGRMYLDLIGHQGAVRGLAWRADSNVLVSGSEDGTIRIWELNSGNQLKSVNAHAGGVTGVAVAKDGRIVTSGRDKSVKFWNADGSLVATMPPFDEPALEVAITHDGSKILAGDWSGRTVLWSATDAKQVSELAANPPRLEDQQAALAKQIADLEAQLRSAELTAATHRGNLETAKKQDVDLVSELEIVQQRLTQAKTEKQAAEKDLQEKQSLMVQQDQSLEKSKARSQSLDHDARAALERLTLAQKQLNDTTERLNGLAAEKLALEQLLAEVLTEHDRQKSDLLGVMIAHSEAELGILVQLQADGRLISRIEESVSDKQSQLEALNQHVGSVMESSKQIEQQLELAKSELKSAGETESATKAELDRIKATVESKSKEVELLQAQIAQSQDEATKTLLQEKLRTAEAELEKLHHDMPLAEKRLTEATGRTVELNEQLQETTKTLEAIKKEAAQATAERDQVASEVTSLIEQQKQTAQKNQALSRQLDALRTEIASAERDRQQTILTLSELLEKANGSRSQLELASRTVDEVRAEEAVQRMKASELDAAYREMVAAACVVQEEIETATTKRAELCTQVDEQRALIESVQSRVSEDLAAIQPLEEQIRECRSRIEQEEKGLAAAYTVVESLSTQFEQNRVRLKAMDAELVAFKSQMEALRQQLASAQAAAQESREILDPEVVTARAMEESIASRETELAEMVDALNRLKQQVDNLRQAQTTAQATLEAKQAKIRSLEAAVSEAESSLDTAQERVEFFESAYGRE